MSKRRACVMGHPVAHSRSPMLHGYWLRTLGLDGSYEFQDKTAEEFETFLLEAARPDALAVCAQSFVLRHEDVADGVVARLRQLEAGGAGRGREELVRNLDQNASPVTRKRIGADCASSNWQCASSVPSTIFISYNANCAPMQRRMPPPNGSQCTGSTGLSRNLSGLKRSGSGYTSGLRCAR